MSAKRRPFQRNAADPRQASTAGRMARDRKGRERNDLRAVLEHEYGRRTIWRFLEFCGIHQTVLRENPLEMAAAAGRQNVGQFILAEVEAADDEMIFVMMREARAALQRDNLETEATAKAEAQEPEDGSD